MSSVAVFVFVLDNLPGFNFVLNDTLVKTTYPSITPTLEKCDPVTSDQILGAISQETNVQYIPAFSTEEKDKMSKETLAEELINKSLVEEENLIDASVEKIDRMELPDNFYNHYRRSATNGSEDKLRFPKSAPFLVAIFETLSNVTAQTCAGTLIHPRWVLTAASCVNVLSSMLDNTTNTLLEYTIIANATNPLLDGAVYNVTSIHLHPDSNNTMLFGNTGPYVALMKIVPEAEGAMGIIGEWVEWGNVMIYGWVLTQNVSGHDEMRLERMSALIMSNAECHAMYSFKDQDVICLFNNDFDKNIKELSTGGPVLMLHKDEVKILAVVQTDERLFLAYPLSALHTWINDTLTNK